MSPEATASSSDEPELLHTQALLVTAGPFAGRICLNDDDEPLRFEDLDCPEFAWIAKENIRWRTVSLTPEEAGEESEQFDVVDCEIVTFGYHLACHGHYYIPRQFLSPATMKDLIQRHQEISDTLMRAAFRVGRSPSKDKLFNLLLEQQMIGDEIKGRDAAFREPSVERNLFLCHASEDKPYVRRIAADLKTAGHAVWMDEFEIKVGDSIVQKISDATAEADALILFISKAALKSEWVKREWSSALARSLSGASMRVLPVLIDDSKPPPLVADVKFADFRESYAFGLRELTSSLTKF